MEFATREAKVQRRKSMTKITVGGWSARRKLNLKSTLGVRSIFLLRPIENCPYEQLSLPSGELLHVLDSQIATYPGQRVEVYLNDFKAFEIANNRIEYTCIGDELAEPIRIATVNTTRWFQYQFYSSTTGDLQIDQLYNVWFDTTIPLGLAIGLQLLLDTRSGS